jgi:hypothetical protein
MLYDRKMEGEAAVPAEQLQSIPRGGQNSHKCEE